MAQCVTTGTVCACSFGDTPAALTAQPARGALADQAPLATIDMIVADANLAPFGMCSAPNNPAVQSATSAASGTPTPAPCQPAVLLPWMPPSHSLTAGGIPVVLSTSTCQCSWQGEISIVALASRAWTAT